MKRMLYIMVCALLLTACKGAKTVYERVEVPVYVHDTTQTVRVERDSVYVDRWRTQYVKGDTVYVTDTQITVKWRERIDTAYKVVEKPVEVVKEQIKEVPRKMPKACIFLMFIGIGSILVLVAWILNRIFKISG